MWLTMQQQNKDIWSPNNESQFIALSEEDKKK